MYSSNRVFERREAQSVPAAMDDACIIYSQCCLPQGGLFKNQIKPNKTTKTCVIWFYLFQGTVENWWRCLKTSDGEAVFSTGQVERFLSV